MSRRASSLWRPGRVADRARPRARRSRRRPAAFVVLDALSGLVAHALHLIR